MAYPSGVITRNVSFGGAVVLENGEPLAITVVTKSSRSLIWVATGERLESISETIVSSDPGDEVVFDLPVTDQNGYLDGETRQAIIVDGDEATHTHTTEIFASQDGAKWVSRAVIGPYALPRGAAIASPAADVAALKTAVDALRTVLSNVGLTA